MGLATADDTLYLGDALSNRFAEAFSWRATSIVCGVMALIGIASLSLGTQVDDIDPGFFSILGGSTVVAQFACASVILGYGYVTRCVQELAVGAAYLLSACLGAQYLLALPNVAQPLASLAAGTYSTYLWLAWHAAFPYLVLVSLLVGLVDRGRWRLSTPALLSITLAIAAITTSAAFGVTEIVRHIHAHIPLSTRAGQFGDAGEAAVAASICAIDSLAIVLITTSGFLKSTTSRTLTIGLFASLLDTVISLTCSPRSYGWYAGTIFTTLASTVILVAFVSEFTWRRAIAKAQEEFSSSNAADRKAAQERLMYLAYHDDLTGLHNRMRWQDILRERLIAASNAPAARELAVLFVDLDRFKELNDAGGHAHGDEILVESARRLQSCAGAHDVVGRLGGDEFALLCDGADPDALAESVLAILRKPILTATGSSDLSATIGVARFPIDGVSVEELLRNADQALYHGKRGGGDSATRYDVVMTAERRNKRKVREALASALPNNEFVLHYQPIFDFKTLACESVEGLLRWKSAAIGPVSPAVFITIAEQADVMREIGRWTLETAIAQLGIWHQPRMSAMPPRIAVNVSARQLRDPLFFEHIVALLAKHHVSASRLELEITESAAMADTDAAVELLARCRNLGVRVTLDDFGTHYSSLTYLQRLPIDTIKIDQTFVQGLPFNDGDAAIVRNIINLGHDMRRTIVAEGIETREQFDWLQRAGCDFAQGFLLARPMGQAAISRRVVAHFSGRTIASTIAAVG